MKICGSPAPLFSISVYSASQNLASSPFSTWIATLLKSVRAMECFRLSGPGLTRSLIYSVSQKKWRAYCKYSKHQRNSVPIILSLFHVFYCFLQDYIKREMPVEVNASQVKVKAIYLILDSIKKYYIPMFTYNTSYSSIHLLMGSWFSSYLGYG